MPQLDRYSWSRRTGNSVYRARHSDRATESASLPDWYPYAAIIATVAAAIALLIIANVQ